VRDSSPPSTPSSPWHFYQNNAPEFHRLHNSCVIDAVSHCAYIHNTSPTRINRFQPTTAEVVTIMHAKSNWNLYRTRFLVRARQLTQPLIFTDSLGREHCGQPGDYLLETSDGVRRITTRTLFEDIYVPLSPDQFSLSAGAVKKADAVDGVPRGSPSHHSEPRHSATA
jgi:hypothetical protein